MDLFSVCKELIVYDICVDGSKMRGPLKSSLAIALLDLLVIRGIETLTPHEVTILCHSDAYQRTLF